MALTTAKELKRLDNQAFYSALNESIRIIQEQFNRAKKEDITYSLSKAGKFDIWLEHSQLTDNVNHTLEDLMEAIKEKKRKSKLLKLYEQMMTDFQHYLDNWHKVDEALKTNKMETIFAASAASSKQCDSSQHRGSNSSRGAMSSVSSASTYSSSSCRSNSTDSGNTKRWL